MSGLTGIYNRNNAPVSSGKLNSMMEPMLYWGPDGTQTYLNGPVGFCHFMRRNMPESAADVQPLKSECGNYVLLSHSRLDNRNELVHQLGIPKTAASILPDSQLILKSYLKWGIDCVHHLLGDWIFALWDNKRHYLFIARDHHGSTGLFYYDSPNFFTFASSVKGILALSEVPHELNETYLARYLACFNKHDKATIFKNIYRLPPAHYMIVTKEKTTLNQYWFLKDTEEIRFQNEDDYVDAFLEIFTEAVKCRLRSSGKVGSTLSGGLDSSSVAAIAARELGQAGKKLHTFSSVPLYEPDRDCPEHRILDESPWILETTKLYPNMSSNLLKAGSISPVQGILKTLEILDEPVHAAANLFWLQSIYEEAARNDVQTLLIGQNGNSTISWQAGDYLANLAFHLRLLKFAKEVRITQKKLIRGSLRVLKHQILPQLIPGILYRNYCIYKGEVDAFLNKMPLNQNFSKRIQISRLLLEHDHFIFNKNKNGQSLRMNLIRPGQHRAGGTKYQMSAGTNMEIADPTIDKRVLEYCTSIPEDQFYQNGQSRLLIRRAMKNILPDKVRLCTRRGLQASDLVTRLYHTRNEVKEYLNQISASDFVRSYLDIPKMWQVYQRLEKGENVRRDNMVNSILLRGLMAGLFLMRFDK